MDIIIWMILALMIGFLIYQLLPSAACLLVMRLNNCKVNNNKPYRLPLMLPARWKKKILVYLERAGFYSEKARILYCLLMVITVPFVLLTGLIFEQPLTQTLMPGIMIICSINAWINRRISRRKNAFAKALYKIYRFLNLQSTAGVKITDSLKGIPEAIQDTAILPIFIRFAARYELTLDFDQSFQEIRDCFGGTDCDLMATQIRQCLQTGDAGKSLHRMEDLMFARYFSMMQAESQKIRFHLLISALFGIAPAAILFMFPLLYQAVTAIQSVFG